MQKEAMEFCKNNKNEKRFKTPSSVALILIRNNNGKEEILLQKRKNTGYMDGYYDLGASGHVENKETMKMALIRETKEEIGITIKEQDIEFTTIIHDISKKIYYNTYFKVTKWEGEPQIIEKDKIEEIKWCDINELPSNIIDNILIAINNYKNNISYSEKIQKKEEKINETTKKNYNKNNYVSSHIGYFSKQLWTSTSHN